MKSFRTALLAAVILGAAAIPPARANVPRWHDHRAWAPHVVVPQARSFALARGASVEIEGVEAGVVILEQVATTTMDIKLKNPTSARLEAEMLVPVPDGAVVRSFTFEGAAKEPSAELLPRDQARGAYDSIVAQVRDPALLEFAGYNLVRSSVFPVEPHGAQKIRLTYEHVLPADGDRVDYVLPRSESLDYKVPWKISVRVKAKKPVSTVYSPSHRIRTERGADNVVSARIEDGAGAEPGPFRLSYLLEREGIAASLFAYPDPAAKGGYFLLLMGSPARPKPEEGAKPVKREVTLVLDRSGSMNGEKMEQAREAARQVLSGLDEGEAFRIVAYNEGVEVFSEQAVLATPENLKAARAYLDGIRPRGGTNIHDAILEALRPRPLEKGMFAIVLFLTDGLPTIGQTSEKAIREAVRKANPHDRRVFTFGVGVDVNTPLLDKIASEMGGLATFVLPKEDVEVKVGQVFRKLKGPILTGPRLELVDGKGNPDLGRTQDLIPARVPDLFEGDQLVLLGRYVGEEPLRFRLKGDYLGKARDFEFSFNVDSATTRNSFVPRLWASRKIGRLSDAIREMGADSPVARLSGSGAAAAAAADPKMRELVDEIVRLSTEFGILTEYTAFLAREGTDLSDRDSILAEAGKNFVNRAWATRDGTGSVNQEENGQYLRSQACLNMGNAYWDANMSRVSVATVQQVNDRAFYRRGNAWVDSRVADQAASKPDRTVEFGSREFSDLVENLCKSGREGTIALRGDILMEVEGKTVLVKAPAKGE